MNDLTHREDPAYLSTLALANAAAGNFTNAVAVAELAMTKGNEQHLTILTKKIESDLASYRLGKNPPVNWDSP
jgi:hypothetical protein